MTPDLRLNAYVLAADPWFLAESVRAYYAHVRRIVVSYDRSSTSWSGTPLPVGECLRILKALDVEGKCVLAPGDFWRPDERPLDNDTHQRRVALDQAGEGADWVLQLDTDEVIPSFGTFFGVLRRAEDHGAAALDYPARWLYARVGDVAGGGRYLEASTRSWRAAAGFPGPLAVRPGVRLHCARQVQSAPHYRVDLRPWNTDPAHAHGTIVHEVVPIRDAVVHYSWVRSDEYMRRKLGWSGHSPFLGDPRLYRRWVWRSKHPYLIAATAPFRSAPARYRIATVRPEAAP